MLLENDGLILTQVPRSPNPLIHWPLSKTLFMLLFCFPVFQINCCSKKINKRKKIGSLPKFWSLPKFDWDPPSCSYFAFQYFKLTVVQRQKIDEKKSLASQNFEASQNLKAFQHFGASLGSWNKRKHWDPWIFWSLSKFY